MGEFVGILWLFSYFSLEKSSAIFMIAS